MYFLARQAFEQDFNAMSNHKIPQKQDGTVPEIVTFCIPIRAQNANECE
jgi:hypothetical protein